MVPSCKRDKTDAVPINLMPIAKAGSDQNIALSADTAFLDGTGSNDPDGTIKEWLWTAVSGPTSFTIVNATLAKTAVINLTAGVYKFVLKVTDDRGAVGRDTMQVAVIQSRAPIAKAGADVSITQPSCSSLASVELDGSSSSDPDNSILTYNWTKISGPVSFNLRNNTKVKAVAENLVPGVYGFELQAVDPQGLISKDTVLVNVMGAALVEYNLDISYNGGFSFLNNEKDCYYFPCVYNDVTNIEASGSFGTIGQLNFSVYEVADTAASSDPASSSMSLWNNNGRHANGTGNINFKKLIQKGGGPFIGTMTITGGSAEECTQDIFKNLPPLTVTGTMDTTAHTVIVNIKGKIFF